MVELEIEPHTELKLAQSIWSVRGGVGFDSGDAAASSVIHREVSLGAVEAQNGVVKEVVSVEAEPGYDGLSNVEGLSERKIRAKEVRPAVGVATNITNLSAGWESEWAGSWTRQRAEIRSFKRVVPGRIGQINGIDERRNRSEPSEVPAGIAMQTGLERLTWQEVRPAIVVRYVHIGDVSALAEGGGKWQATTPIGGAGDLPAADQVIFPTTCVGKEFLAFAKAGHHSNWWCWRLASRRPSNFSNDLRR